jgi:hypothetical protein
VAARSELPQYEVPAFLHEYIDRLAALAQGQPARKRQSSLQTSLLVLAGAATGAFLLGFLIGRATARRGDVIAPEQLEAAADQIKDTWPGIHDDDIRDARGDLKRLSSVIVERTGEDTRSVRERLASITAQASSVNGGKDGS